MKEGVALADLTEKPVIVLDLDPVCTDTDRNFVRLQVLWYHRLQCGHIALKALIYQLCIVLCDFQLFTDIARKIFARILIAGKRLIVLDFSRIAEDFCAKLRNDLFWFAADKLCHIRNIHSAVLVQRYLQCLLRRFHRSDLHLRLNGSFREYFRFFNGFLLHIYDFQSRKRIIVIILPKAALVHAVCDVAVGLAEFVIYRIQFTL